MESDALKSFDMYTFFLFWAKDRTNYIVFNHLFIWPGIKNIYTIK